MRKKKLLIHSNNSQAFTGFGKNVKNILSYLARQGKYDIVGRPLIEASSPPVQPE